MNVISAFSGLYYHVDCGLSKIKHRVFDKYRRFCNLVIPRIALLFLRTRVALGAQKALMCVSRKMWSFTTATVRFAITASSKKVATNDCDNDHNRK